MNSLLYIDPGSGSYLVQALIAGALGIVFFFRNIITYIRGFFGMLFGKKKSPEPNTEAGNSNKGPNVTGDHS